MYVRTGVTTMMKVKSCLHLVKNKHFRRQMKLKATSAFQRKICFFEITAVLTDPTVMSKLHSSGTKLQNPRPKMWLFINTLDCLYTNLPTWLKLLVNKREKLDRFDRRNPSRMVSISWALSALSRNIFLDLVLFEWTRNSGWRQYWIFKPILPNDTTFLNHTNRQVSTHSNIHRRKHSGIYFCSSYKLFLKKDTWNINTVTTISKTWKPTKKDL